jgi:hypothetical protein
LAVQQLASNTLLSVAEVEAVVEPNLTWPTVQVVVVVDSALALYQIQHLEP